MVAGIVDVWRANSMSVQLIVHEAPSDNDPLSELTGKD